MAVILGIMISIGSMLGGYMAMGGHVDVLWQPFEFVIIFGIALGIFVVANTIAVIKQTGGAIMDAVSGKAPKRGVLL